MMLIRILAMDGQHSDWRWSETTFIAFVYLYSIVKPPGKKDKKSTGKSWKSTGNLFFRVVRHPDLARKIVLLHGSFCGFYLVKALEDGA